MKSGYSLKQAAGLVQGLGKSGVVVTGNSGEVGTQCLQSYREGAQMAIKAYMSARRIGSAQENEDWAITYTNGRDVCEAQRILADVEPREWGLSGHEQTHRLDTRGAVLGSAASNGALALAESLAAFVEMI